MGQRLAVVESQPQNMVGILGMAFFNIGTAGVKKGCFALVLLVGTSFLNQDTNYKKLERNRDLNLTELYTNEQITNVYKPCNLSVGPVRVHQSVQTKHRSRCIFESTIRYYRIRLPIG